MVPGVLVQPTLKKYNLGSYDKPATHDEAMKTLQFATLTEPDTYSIVGQSSDKSQLYIIRKSPDKQSVVYEYINPKNNKIELEIEQYKYKTLTETIIRDSKKNAVYKFENDKLFSINFPSKGIQLSPGMPQFDSFKIDILDPMQLITSIEK